MITLRRILIPIDFSPHSEQALKYGIALAEKFGAELFLIHAFQDVSIYQTEVVSGAPPIMPPVEQLTATARGAMERLVREKDLHRFGANTHSDEAAPVE